MAGDANKSPEVAAKETPDKPGLAAIVETLKSKPGKEPARQDLQIPANFLKELQEKLGGLSTLNTTDENIETNTEKSAEI